MNEEAVSVTVEDIESGGLEPALRPEQHLATRAGDGIRQGRVEEAAGRGSQHSIEGVHEDLDGVRGDVVAGLLGRLAPRKQVIQHAGQDRGCAPECASGHLDEVVVRARCRDIGQWIDVERADDAGVQALEVEHPDVAMEPGAWLEDVASLLGGMNTRVIAAHGRSHDTPALELREIKKVEGGDTRRHPVGCHARKLTPRERQPDEVEFPGDLKSKARVSARVLCECRQVVLVVMDDLADAIADIATDRFAFSEHFSRHRVQRVVVHAHERATQQVDAVQHQATGDRGLPAAEVAFRLA